MEYQSMNPEKFPGAESPAQKGLNALNRFVGRLEHMSIDQINKLFQNKTPINDRLDQFKQKN